MKTYSLVLIGLFFTVSTLAHGGSHSSLPEPGHTPVSLMYSVDQVQERVSLALTFSEEKRMHKKIRFARERLSESAKLMEQNRSAKAAEMAQKYVQQLQELENKSEKMKNTENVKQLLNETKSEDDQVLKSLSEQLPEKAQKGIETAIKNRNKSNKNTTENPAQEKTDTQKPSGYIATGRVVRSE